MSQNGTDYMGLVRELDWNAVRVASALPGRIRLRSSQLRDDDALGARIEDTLAAINAVTDVSLNVRTGSVLVHYDDEQLDDLPTLIDRAATVGVLPEGLDPAELKAMAQAHANGTPPTNFSVEAQRFFASVNESVGDLTGGAIDLKGLAPLTLLGLGVRRLLRGGPLESVPWFNYFWFAFTLFVTFAPNEAETNDASRPQTAPSSSAAAPSPPTVEV